MATAAFKSTTKGAPIGASSASSTDDSSSSNRYYSVRRRARSLSQAPRRVPSHDSFNDPDEFPAPRGKFVNTVRGSGFPEISLDDLAVEYFESANRGRTASPPLEPYWAGPMVMRLVPPRDWPPRGWEVDRKELAFMREVHKLQRERWLNNIRRKLQPGESKISNDVIVKTSS